MVPSYRSGVLLALLLGLLPVLPTVSAAADTASGRVLAAPPAEPAPDQSYLFYLHGRIVEDGGPRPSNERFGTYEYPEILERLAAAGFLVISEQRKPGTDIDTYADLVAAQVRGLLAAGVPPRQITVMGFSKGGGIAIRTSSRLAEPALNFVFLGACGSRSPEPTIRVAGHILTIHEESDSMAFPCDGLFEQAGAVPRKRELTIRTGKDHGAFWQPRDEWLEPAIEWARSAGERSAD